MSDFGDLRSAVHGEPGDEPFEALIEVFEEASVPGDEVERIWVPYAFERVREWPVYWRTLRVGDPSVLGDSPPAWMSLLGGLHLARHEYPEGFLRELVCSARVAGLERLSYDHARPPEGFLSWIAGSPHLVNLRHLAVRTPAAPAEYLSLAGSSTLRLRSFSAHAGDVGDVGALAIADSPVFAGLEALTLTACAIGDQGARAIGSAPFMTRLERLCMNNNAFGAEGAVALLSRRGRAWRHLDLSSHTLGPDAIPALVASERLGLNRTLILGRCGLGDDDAVALAGSEQLGELRVLDLSHNQIGDRGAIALAGAGLSKLKDLNLELNDVGAAGALALMRSPNLGSLETLDLDGNACEDDGFEPPVDGSPAGGLSDLFLSNCSVGPRLFAEVLGTKRLSTIVSLKCRNARLGVEGARAFGARVASLDGLEGLDLEAADEGFAADERLGDEGFEALLAPDSARRLTALTQLDVGSNGLTDASAHVLPGSGLPSLDRLFVDANPISDAWISALVASEVCRHLIALDLQTTFVTDRGLEAIADSPMLWRLEVLYVSDVRATERGLLALLTSSNLPNLATLAATVSVTDEAMREVAACPHLGELDRLVVGVADLSEEVWRALATSEHLRSLDFFDFRGPRERCDDVLERLRAEGAWLNPWAARHERSNRATRG